MVDHYKLLIIIVRGGQFAIKLSSVSDFNYMIIKTVCLPQTINYINSVKWSTEGLKPLV